MSEHQQMLLASAVAVLPRLKHINIEVQLDRAAPIVYRIARAPTAQTLETLCMHTAGWTLTEDMRPVLPLLPKLPRLSCLEITGAAAGLEGVAHSEPHSVRCLTTLTRLALTHVAADGGDDADALKSLPNTFFEPLRGLLELKVPQTLLCDAALPRALTALTLCGVRDRYVEPGYLCGNAPPEMRRGAALDRDISRREHLALDNICRRLQQYPALRALELCAIVPSGHRYPTALTVVSALKGLTQLHVTFRGMANVPLATAWRSLRTCRRLSSMSCALFNMPARRARSGHRHCHA